MIENKYENPNIFKYRILISLWYLLAIFVVSVYSSAIYAVFINFDSVRIPDWIVDIPVFGVFSCAAFVGSGQSFNSIRAIQGAQAVSSGFTIILVIILGFVYFRKFFKSRIIKYRTFKMNQKSSLLFLYNLAIFLSFVGALFLRIFSDQSVHQHFCEGQTSGEFAVFGIMTMTLYNFFLLAITVFYFSIFSLYFINFYKYFRNRKFKGL